MKKILLCLMLLSAFVPMVRAASDCAHTCCRTFDGSWDEDFDDCRAPKSGFDSCVSQCEADVYANRPQMPESSNVEHVNCCGSALIIASVLAGAAFISPGSGRR